MDAARTLHAVADEAPTDAACFVHDDPGYREPFSMLYDWTWEVPLSAPARALYAYILHRIGANKEGKSWARRKTIAHALQIGERSLHKYLHELEHAGMIRIETFPPALGRPAAYRVQTQAAVLARQNVVQHMERTADAHGRGTGDATPACGAATAPANGHDGGHADPLQFLHARFASKSCMQELQGNKDIDTRDIDTKERDTVGDEGRAARGAASAPAPALAMEAASVPPAAPAERQRKAPLRTTEPAVYEAREAIKAHWYALTGQTWDELSGTRQKYLNADAEALARKCRDVPEALAAMQAVYDFAWANGTHPYRTPLRLQKVVELLKAYREGSLGRAPTMSVAQAAQVEEAMTYFDGHLRPVLDDEEERFRAWAWAGIEGFGLDCWLGTARCLASDPHHVGNPHTTTDTVTRLAAFWEDSGRPRTWREMEERKKRHIANGRN